MSQESSAAAHQDSGIDLTAELTERVLDAARSGRALQLCGGGTKSFLGRECAGERLGVAGHLGILDYWPEELVVTARAGTPIETLERVLAESGQRLPFEPPRFGPGATLGGTVACGLSGPARPYAGSVRDLVLGARVLTGRGEVLRFGGQVMKNVAGYDLSRLMVGAFGTLGVLLDLSIRVLPIPPATRTQVLDLGQAQALETMTRWAGRPLPVSATCWDGERLWARLSGAAQAVAAAASSLGGESLDGDSAEAFWAGRIREQGHGVFVGDLPLWRLSLPAETQPLDLPGRQLIEWGGALRWLKSEAEPESIRAAVERVGGHATLFRAGGRAGLRRGEVFPPLGGQVKALHINLKRAFDPGCILNPGRMYDWL